MGAKESRSIMPTRHQRRLPVEQSLIQEENKNQTHTRKDRAYPKSPSPAHTRHDEGSDQGTEVWAEDNGELHIVDDLGMLVEEEQILDPHQSSALSNAAEEAVDDTSSEI